MMSLLSTLVTLVSVFAALSHAKSYIATFADANCQESLNSLDGPNGYPNGTCTDLRRSGTYGSFQVVGLDAGCAVTIYVDDIPGVSCSGALQVATLASCYNSTWAFYSIDLCTAGGATNTVTPTILSSTSSPSSTSTSATSNTAVPITSSSASATAGSSSGGTSTGAIVGGAVGGVLGLALIICGTVLLYKRMGRRSGKEEEAAISEVHGNSVVPKQEIYEKMGNEPAPPPVELPVDEHTTAGADIAKTPPR